MRIILASASPRRRELLHQIGWEFEVCVSQVEERITKILPAEVVEELSAQKAQAVFDHLQGHESVTGSRQNGEPIVGSFRSCSVPGGEPEAGDDVGAVLVIGADTVVACDGEILGKPADREDAVRMLHMLQGRSHQVYTGVTVCCRRADGQVVTKTFHEETEVTFYAMAEEEIQAYVDSKDPMDKAGAYGIQGICARYISGIRGDYNNVVGLPVGRLYQEVCNLTK